MKPSIPVFYINQDAGGDLGDGLTSPKGKGPQYPALKLNVSVYQREVADIMEESIEEKRRESLNISRQSKIKQRLSIQRSNQIHSEWVEDEEENIKMVKINVDDLEDEAAETLLKKLD